MGLFSALGDFFGGQAKVRALPPELRELAGSSKEMADRLYAMFHEGDSRMQPWIDRMEGYADDAISDLDGKHNLARFMAGDTAETYMGQVSPLTKQTWGDMIEAGSPGRIDQAGGRARDDFLTATDAALEQQQRMGARLGWTTPGGALNPQTALMQASGAAAAENAARFRERAYGEGIRLNALPMMLNERGAAITMAGLPSMVNYEKLGLAELGGSAYPSMTGRLLPMATGAGTAGTDAYNKYSSNFEHDLHRDQMNASRRSNMIETGVNLAGMAFGLPGVGSALRGGNAGGIYGGVGLQTGENPWGNFKMPSFLGGGGGGGNSSPYVTGRHTRLNSQGYIG